jgi:phosphoribosylpyrophosphate synthetase
VLYISKCRQFNGTFVTTDAKRASARHNPVIPYFGYARQDRKDKTKKTIGAKLLVAKLLETAEQLEL